MIVAVTGGTGFIGRHLIARHVGRGDQVRYLTRQPPDGGIPGASAVIGNLNSTAEQLKPFARGVDVLYHCAAELRNETEMRRTNVAGTANLLSAAGAEIGRWVQLSSTGVYGAQLPANVDEHSTENPSNPYEISKLASDRILRDAVEHRDFPCVFLRPSNVYATDMPNQSLFQLIQMIDRGAFFFIGQRGAIANYIHVENVIDAMVACATATLPANGRAYIVSDHVEMEALVATVAAALGRGQPWLRLPKSLVHAVSVASSVIPGFPLTPSRVNALTGRTIYRSDRIRAELGYEHRISMAAGIGELARHWKHRQTGS